MYMRITRGTVDAANYETVSALFAEVRDAVARQPGLRHYHAGGNAQTGEIVAVSLWDTEEHANFPRESLGEIVRKMGAAGARLAPAEVYEVQG
jgi:heme-degrading monooxygenase HmoA